MTISTTTNQITYLGDGVTLAFSFPYPSITTSDLKIYVNGVAVTTGFVVTGTQPFGGSGTYSNSTVTFSVAPASLATVLIYCDPDQLQSTSLPPNDPFPSKTVEKMVDKLTLLIQAIYRKFGNAITFPVGDTASGVLPDAATRANKIVSFDASGNAITLVPAAGSAASVLTMLANSASAVEGAALVGFNPTLSYALGNVGRRLADQYFDPTDYPWLAVGDGNLTTRAGTDDTAALQACIVAARAAKRKIRLPAGKIFRVTSSLVLSSNTLASVDLEGPSPEWYDATQRQSGIFGDFNAPLLIVRGTAPTNYASGSSITNTVLSNHSTGTSASLVDCAYSGGLRMGGVYGSFRNIGVVAVAEAISPRFSEVCLTSPFGFSGVACYRMVSRNPVWITGRAYAANYAFDINGDAPTYIGVNIEFCDVAFRSGAISNGLASGCHIETSQCLFTNADTVPIAGGAWVNNASAGPGILGSMKFQSCLVAFSNTQTNLITIKAGGGFGYVLEIDSCAITATNPIIGNSFAPGSSVALPSGMKVIVRNTTGLTVAKPPVDSFSGYLFENAATQGYTDVSGLKINGNETISIYDQNTYTPSWSSTGTQPALGNGTISGKYTAIGNLIRVKILLGMGSTTTYGTGFWQFSVPPGFTLTDGPLGSARAVDQGSAVYTGFAYAGGNVITVLPAGTATNSYGPTVPHTWANTDSLEIEFFGFTS